MKIKLLFIWVILAFLLIDINNALALSPQSDSNLQQDITKIKVANNSLEDNKQDPVARNQLKTHIFKIKYRNPKAIYNVIAPYIQTYIPGVSATVSERLGTITIKDMKSVIDTVGLLIQEYDIPLRRILLEVTLLQAENSTEGKNKYPKKLDKLIKNLNSLFKFNKYIIIGEASSIAFEESPVEINSHTDLKSFSRFSIKTRIYYTNDIIKLNSFSLSFTPHQRYKIFNSTINIKDGETIIVGASPEYSAIGSIITIVTAKVVEEH